MHTALCFAHRGLSIDGPLYHIEMGEELEWLFSLPTVSTNSPSHHLQGLKAMKLRERGRGNGTGSREREKGSKEDE